MTKKKTLKIFIDGDIILHKNAAVAEEAINWGDDWWGLYADLRTAKSQVMADIGNYLKATKNCYAQFKDIEVGDIGDIKLTIVLSDKENNWRHQILPSYKLNRKSKRKPILLNPLREWMIKVHGAIWWAGLEADDVIGILASRESIVISEDKDFETIPCLLYKPSRDKLQKITKLKANKTHLYQTLTGDAADGYSGCPGIGPVNAKRILDVGTWKEVVVAYEGAGLEEEDAMVQARVAHILRSKVEYRRKSCKVRLWHPSFYGRRYGVKYDKELSNQYIRAI